MPPRIAIPMPHSSNHEYAERAIPQYERAVELAGGMPIRIPLDQTLAEVKKIVQTCDGVLLPGSNADVDPAKFRQPASPHTAAADSRREEVDFVLLTMLTPRRKPVLGICYGLQSLNVYCAGIFDSAHSGLPAGDRSQQSRSRGGKECCYRAYGRNRARVEITTDSR